MPLAMRKIIDTGTTPKSVLPAQLSIRIAAATVSRNNPMADNVSSRTQAKSGSSLCRDCTWGLWCFWDKFGIIRLHSVDAMQQQRPWPARHCRSWYWSRCTITRLGHLMESQSSRTDLFHCVYLTIGKTSLFDGFHQPVDGSCCM
jgi:hypothetical protein